MAGSSLSPLTHVKAGLTRATREAYRREIGPERSLLWFGADGMREWLGVLAKRLAPHLETSGTPPIDRPNTLGRKGTA